MALNQVIRNVHHLKISEPLKKTLSTAANQFRLEVIQPHQWEKYIPIIEKHFIPYEPIGLGLGSTQEDMGDFLKQGVKEWCSHGVSTVAIHVPTNEIAGVNFNKILTREQSSTFKKIEVEDNETEKLVMTKNLLIHLEESYNVFEDPKVNKVHEIAVAAVDKKFSGNQLAYRLIREGLKLGVAEGCDGTSCQATNKISALICEKLGLKEKYCFDYGSFIYNGKKVMNVAAMGKGNECAKVYFGRVPQDLTL